MKKEDEEALLKVPGARYVPLVGKVTVAMVERKLIRLIHNLHLVDVLHTGSTVYKHMAAPSGQPHDTWSL